MMGEVICEMVYNMTDRTAVAFELDSENQQDDYDETVKQSIFIVTDREEVIQL
jgi:hypothetical protein